MKRTEPRPRFAPIANEMACGTWLEAEELTYPSGGKIRRARAYNTATGRLSVVRCGIPDTYFTIPCRGGGYLDISDGGILRFNPPKPN
jgi:hypothetical protein